MNNEKWQNTLGKIKDSFQGVEEGSEPMAEHGGTRAWIIFQGPLGKMKLERIAHPRVVGKTVLHSKRIGSSATVEYTYDETDIVGYVKAYKWNEGTQTWDEMKAPELP